MGYKNGKEILPNELIQLIQQYVDGENIYIPRRFTKCKGNALTSKEFAEYVNRNEIQEFFITDESKGSKTIQLNDLLLSGSAL